MDNIIEIQDLADALGKLVFQNLSSKIDPLINEHSVWANIESEIHNWFKSHDVLGSCIDITKKLNGQGKIFRDQDGNLITAEKVSELLKINKFVQKSKEDILDHYSKKVPEIEILDCGPNSKPFIKRTRDNKIVARGCLYDPKKPSRHL